MSENKLNEATARLNASLASVDASMDKVFVDINAVFVEVDKTFDELSKVFDEQAFKRGGVPLGNTVVIRTEDTTTTIKKTATVTLLSKFRGWFGGQR